MGVNLNFAKRKTQLFGYIKITERIPDFKTSSLSIMGRVTLAKCTLSSIAQHTLAVFKLPVSVANQVDKETEKFIWLSDREERGIHWKLWGSIANQSL